jgi:hypothetical protein
MGENPIESTYLIMFLNSKNKQELEELDIEDGTETILEIKKGSNSERPHVEIRRKMSGYGYRCGEVLQQV